MKAHVVDDIRFAQGVPGAIEWHAGKLTIFYTCPCGCGSLGWVGMLKCYSMREPPSIYELAIDPSGKLCGGEPLFMGLLNEDGTAHWAGTLTRGEWKEDKTWNLKSKLSQTALSLKE